MNLATDRRHRRYSIGFGTATRHRLRHLIESFHTATRLHCIRKITTLHLSGFDFVPAGRLKRLDLPNGKFSDHDITGRTLATKQMAYRVPMQAMDARSWSGLRVQFVRVNRRYIVRFDSLTTHDVARSMRDGAPDGSRWSPSTDAEGRRCQPFRKTGRSGCSCMAEGRCRRRAPLRRFPGHAVATGSRPPARGRLLPRGTQDRHATIPADVPPKNPPPRARLAWQIFTMAFWLRPLASAMVRVLQWVAFSGRVSSVRVMTASTFSSVTFRGWPERGASPRAPGRPSRNRSRHLPTVWRVTLSLAATEVLLLPAPHSRTMRARRAVRGSVLGRRAISSSFDCSSGARIRGLVGRPVATIRRRPTSQPWCTN